jgi:O-antigen ligase
MNLATHRDTILTASFVMWCALLTFPILTIVGDVGPGAGPMPLYQLLGAAQFLAVAVLASRPGALGDRYDNFQAAIIVIIYLSLGLQLYDDPRFIATGLVYTIALIATIAALSLISTMSTDAVARCLGYASVVLVAFGISAIALFGWPHERQLGPIHPNSFGSAMLAAFIFSQFREGTLFLLVRLACLVMAAAVSSRFALFGSLLAFLILEITSRPFSMKLFLLAVLAAACLIVFSGHIVELLALDDPTRNLSSGFTGRDERWSSSFEAIENNPFGMGFRRAPYEAWGHNGYLLILVEFGVLGGGLIIAAVLSIVVGALVAAVTNFQDDSAVRRLASARAAGLVALTFATFFQPQLLNLGDMHGISVMLLLFWRRRSAPPQSHSARQEVRIGGGTSNQLARTIFR